MTEERDFWQHKASLDNEIRLHSNSRFRDFRLTTRYREAWELVLIELADKAGASDQLVKLIEAANRLEIVLSHGIVGKQIEALIDRGDQEIAQRIAVFNSAYLVAVRDNEELYQGYVSFRAAAVFNTLNQVDRDVVSSQEALRIARQASEDLSEALDSTQQHLDEKRLQIDELARLYREKLLIEGPAEHWSKVSTRGQRLAIASFLAFTLMLSLPAFVIYAEWTAISAYIDHVIDTTKGTVSFASLVVFTVPIFGYGWLLKHISRVFSHSLIISSDAEHRKVMAVTFLGLAQNSSVGMTDQDRALILNALFRPVASGTQDEGPPSGLLELIKK